MKHVMATLILSAIGAVAGAQSLPPALHAPPPMAGPLSPEALATIPDLTSTQQTELRKILIERRDAHEAVAAKSRAEREVQAKKDRTEHERIDDESAVRLRKLLGDDGYSRFAEWQLAHRGPGGPGPGPRGPDSRRGPHANGGSGDRDGD